MVLSISFLFCALAVCPPALADPPVTKPSTTRAEQARDYWQNAVVFFGDEEGGQWSLRLFDRDYRENAAFELLELWKYERKDNRWVKLDEPRSVKEIIHPSKKGALAPPESQVLVWFKQIPFGYTSGLWYAKWRVEDIDGSTYIRIGNPKPDKKIPPDRPPAPAGMIYAVVPLDPEHSQYMLIPDPRTACVEKPAPQKAIRQ